MLNGKNLYYINILISVIKRLAGTTKKLFPPAQPSAAEAGSAGPAQPSTSIMNVNDFLFKSGLDNINLFKLKRHVNETNLVNKIGRLPS